MGQLLTRLEAAERLGMSETFVKEEIRRQHLPAVRLGRMVRIDEDDLADYVAAHKTPVVGFAYRKAPAQRKPAKSFSAQRNREAK